MLNKKEALMVIFVLLLIPIVYAVPDSNIFGFLEPNFISNSYNNNYEWWNFFIYLLIFTGVVKAVFYKKFGEGAAGNAITIGLGIGLSLTMVLYEYNLGYSLFSKGGPALVVAGALFSGVAIYTFFRDRKISNWFALPAAIIIPLLFLWLIYNAIYNGSLSGGSLFSLNQGYLIGTAIALLLVFLFIKFVFGSKGASVPGGGGHGGPAGGAVPGGGGPAAGGGGAPGGGGGRSPLVINHLSKIPAHIDYVVNNCIMLSYQSTTAARAITSNAKVMARYPRDITRMQASAVHIATDKPKQTDWDELRKVNAVLKKPGATDADIKFAVGLLESTLVNIRTNLIKINIPNELNDVHIILEQNVKPGLNFPDKVKILLKITTDLLIVATEVKKNMP
ncbi:MAG TPA: hypothetical protein VJJ23_04190 [Candidatus Nanoarchaeia archaeon]|nr:hypothetical protein [Candidatus Nanoarchaeia archaeon]